MSVHPVLSRVSPFFNKRPKYRQESCAVNTSVHPKWNAWSTEWGDDYFGFGVYGPGIRNTQGDFGAANGFAGIYWCQDWPSGWPISLSYRVEIAYNSGIVNTSSSSANGHGFSIRICRPATSYEEQWKDGSLLLNNYKDGDGNNYDGVKIGSLIWSTKNLITTKMQDGTSIPNITSTSDWADAASIYNKNPGRCWWQNNEGTYGVYGMLYNGWVGWASGKRFIGLIDSGTWKVPTSNDWTSLTTYIVNNYSYTSSTVARALKGCRQVNHPNA